MTKQGVKHNSDIAYCTKCGKKMLKENYQRHYRICLKSDYKADLKKASRGNWTSLEDVGEWS